MATWIVLDNSQTHPDDSDFLLYTGVTGNGDVVPPAPDGSTHVTITSEAQLTALANAQKWVDGFPCQAFVRPTPRSVLSQPDNRLLVQFGLKGEAGPLSGVQRFPDTAIPEIEMRHVDSLGVIQTGTNVPFYRVDRDGDDTDVFFPTFVNGVALLDIDPTVQGYIELKSTSRYRVTNSGARLRLRMYTTRLTLKPSGAEAAE